MVFFGQEYSDTMAILDDKRDINVDQLNEIIEKQRILSNRELMLHNFGRLLDNLGECQKYISDVLNGQAAKDANIVRSINNCLSRFTGEDMQLLENMMLKNFNDAMLTNNLAKL